MTPLLAFVLALAVPKDLPWLDDYREAVRQGETRGRLILVHFWVEGRPLSQSMFKETFTDGRVVRLATERFVSVRLESGNDPELFRRLSGSRGGVASCIVDAGEDVVSVLPGYADAGEIVRFLGRALRGYPVLRAIRDDADRRPDRAAVLFALGEEYAALDSRRRAEATFRRAAELKGASRAERRAAAFSHERLARMGAMRGRNVEARKELEAYRSCGTTGREDRAMVTEALACSLERDPKEALRILGEARRRYPRSPERDQMALLTGICQHDAGAVKEALATLEAMVREFAGSPWVHRARERIEHIKNPPPEHEH